MESPQATSNRFSGRVAIVTGGSAGIGLSVVRQLCEQGAAVTLSGIDDDTEAVGAALAAEGHRVLALHGDMQDARFCRAIVDQTLDRFNRVDHLVNNAFSFTAKAMDASEQDWQRSLFAGPVAYARMVQHCAEPMRSAGGGAVVNVSSISGQVAQINRWTYNAAKGSVNQLTRCQALDLAPWNIRVNTVSPGWVWTREVDKAAALDGGGREKWGPLWGQYHMLRRLAEPDEVARPILFLLSDDASFITAADLPVDGGYLAMGPEGLGQTTVNAGSA